MTCKPAMGYSFAAGTTDGPGAFNFKQGEAQLAKIDLLFLECKSMCAIGLTDVLSMHFK